MIRGPGRNWTPGSNDCYTASLSRLARFIDYQSKLLKKHAQGRRQTDGDGLSHGRTERGPNADRRTDRRTDRETGTDSETEKARETGRRAAGQARRQTDRQDAQT